MVLRGTSTNQPLPSLARPGEDEHLCRTAARIGGPGRPGVPSEMIRLSTASLDAARRSARASGIGLREWIEMTLMTHST